MKLLCYAFRSGDGWEAICTDLDIAVHGDDQDSVRASLESAIDMYLEAVAELPELERRPLLLRRSPLLLRLRLALRAALSRWTDRAFAPRAVRFHDEVAAPG